MEKINTGLQSFGPLQNLIEDDLIERLLIWGGRRLDVSNPFVDARLPDGSRLHVAIPEVTAKHWAVNIRKHLNQGNSLADLMELGSINQEILDLLISSINNGFNILVSGGTQAGKTTFLNALISQISPGERVITIEEVFELKPKIPDWIALQTRNTCLLYTSPSPRDRQKSRMPSSA